MSKATAFFALTTLAFGASSIYLYQALRTERELADARQGQVVGAEVESTMTSAPAMELPSPGTVPESRSSDSGALAAAADKSRGRDAKEYSRRLANPAYRAAELAFMRLQLERQFPDLAAALNLRPDEADRLFDLLARQELRDREYEMKVNDEGQVSDEAIAARRRMYQERHQAAEAEQTELLGEAKMSEFNLYRNSLGARAQMRELRTMLAESDYLLRDDQFAPMVSALAAEQLRHRAEREKLYNGSGNPSNSTPQDVIRYMDQRQALIEQSLQRRHQIATRYLDSEQLKRYDEMLNRERKRAQIEYDLFVTSNEAASKGY